MDSIGVGTDIVPLESLTPYAKNARIGDVKAIAESLAVNGQYKPLVVNKRSNEILAGNHTWKAAQTLGWKKIAVVYVDVDDKAAARIVLADNRTSDLGSFDNDILGELLRSLPDLEGTGYDEWDMQNLDSLFDDPPLKEPETPIEPPEGDTTVKVGYYKTSVPQSRFATWKGDLPKDKAAAITIIRKRLGFPESTSPRPERKQRKVEQADLNLAIKTVEKVRIDSIDAYPVNARQGDIGAISESLRVNGQYRPIIVNRADNTILVGNHTWLAARALGWKEIAVAWVEADPVQARKILLADNRTAELGTYDDAALTKLLTSLKNWDGTGWDGDDVDALINGQTSPNPEPRHTITIGLYKDQLTNSEWATWETDIQQRVGYSNDNITTEILTLLGLDS